MKPSSHQRECLLIAVWLLHWSHKLVAGLVFQPGLVLVIGTLLRLSPYLLVMILL